MKLLISACLLFVAVAADRLENTYLPPGSAKTAGGNSQFLQTPNYSKNFVTQAKYLPPSANRQSIQTPNFSKSIATQATYLPPSTTKHTQQTNKFNNGLTSQSNYLPPSTSYGVPTGHNNVPKPQTRDGGAAIFRFNNENNGDGSYRFEYETENKINHEETGSVKNLGSNSESSSVEGSYSYVGDDGQTYTVHYIADENGFRPTGDHIPTPPPVPEAIQKSIQRNGFGNEHQYQASNEHQQANNRQYLAPSVSSKQYSAPSTASRHYSAPAVANNQYLAPSVASRQYLAPNNAQSGYRY